MHCRKMHETAQEGYTNLIYVVRYIAHASDKTICTKLYKVTATQVS